MIDAGHTPNNIVGVRHLCPLDSEVRAGASTKERLTPLDTLLLQLLILRQVQLLIMDLPHMPWQ